MFEPLLNETTLEVLIKYLSAKDVASLQMVCNIFNVNLTSPKLDSFWQPHLNQLHSIDPEIGVIPKQGQSIMNAFIAGADKLKKRQISEISFLLKRHGSVVFKNHPHISKLIKAFNDSKAKLSNRRRNIGNDSKEFEQFISKSNLLNDANDMMVVNAELDVVNTEIIKAKVNKARHETPGRLCIANSITRFPAVVVDSVATKEYWDGLQVLSLNENLLNRIPSNISKLGMLRELSLNNNQLTTLPNSIGDLPMLKLLQVCNNQLSTVPDSMSKLPMLESLHLSNNQLTTLPELISSLSMLKFLSVDANQLATLPNSIGDLPILESLSVNNNQLTTLPDSIVKLRMLKSLFAVHNQLATLPNFIGNLPVLEELSVNNNQLAALPNSLTKLDRKSRVGCANNYLTSIPNELIEHYGKLWGDTQLPMKDALINSVSNMLKRSPQISEVSGDFFDIMYSCESDEVSARTQDAVASVDIAKEVVNFLSRFTSKDKSLVEEDQNKVVVSNVIKNHKASVKPMKRIQRRRLV